MVKEEAVPSRIRSTVDQFLLGNTADKSGKWTKFGFANTTKVVALVVKRCAEMVKEEVVPSRIRSTVDPVIAHHKRGTIWILRTGVN